MRTLGLMMRPLADTILIMPPLTITRASMTRLCEGVLQSLEWVAPIIEQRRLSV